LTLPNLITLFRLLLVPLTIWLILETRFAAAFVAFATAGISDAVDGFIARRFELKSELGAILDPLADKLLLMSVYITFGATGVLATWLVILVVARDVMIVGGFVLLSLLGERPAVRPLPVSKLNTLLQIMLAAGLLVRLGFAVPIGRLPDILALLVAISTVASGTAYLVEWSRAAGREKESP
jgi:cardiolipin synthase